ncbi:MAG: methyltransferase [Oscillospiraceae bacterium]|nr:methyltransferase [Oscillospiraceae bacterium]
MNRIPFDQAEIDNATEVTNAQGRVTKTYAYPVTPKENYRALYARELPLWMPVGGDSSFITPRIDADNVARCFSFEANPTNEEERNEIAANGYKDKFGVTWVYIPQAGGSMVRPGAPTLTDANAWKDVIPFPDVDSWDWEGSKTANANYLNKTRFISVTILSGFFERLISWMDFEGAAMALIDDDQKDAVHAAFDALADVYIKMIDKFIWAYELDQLSFHDDWGSQRAPFFGVDTVKEMLVPYIKKVADYCQSRGVFFDLHSCGKNELLVPAMIDANVVSWSPQPMNDVRALREQYGDKLIFGGIPGFLPAVPFGGPPIEDDVAIAAAKQFVDTYCQPDAFVAKPFTGGGGGFGAPPIYTETMYIETRKAFNP